MLQALLNAGGDLLLRNQCCGCLAIHYAARSGCTSLIRTLISTSPSTLNAQDEEGNSPLGTAALRGHEDVVTLLLSAGASDAGSWNAEGISALRTAVNVGEEAIVRVLLDEGLEAVGELPAIPEAVRDSVEYDHVGILRLLLDVQGEKGCGTLGPELGYAFKATNDMLGPLRSFDTRGVLRAKPVFIPILHFAARTCARRAIHVLLSAGADELVVTARGRQASDDVGLFWDMNSSQRKDTEAAVRRMLKRGPAFRARSWTWPTLSKAALG
ncbi:unnamed protein product, partial [Scytosiphon promiscuus]